MKRELVDFQVPSSSDASKVNSAFEALNAGFVDETRVWSLWLRKF